MKKDRISYPRAQKYSPADEEFRFDLAATDIFNLTAANVSASSSSVLASSAIGASDELYVTGVFASVVGTTTNIAFEDDNTTILVIQASNSVFNSITTSRDAPLAKAAVSSTMRVRSLGAGTFNSSMWGVLEPQYTNMMPL